MTLPECVNGRQVRNKDDGIKLNDGPQEIHDACDEGVEGVGVGLLCIVNVFEVDALDQSDDADGNGDKREEVDDNNANRCECWWREEDKRQSLALYRGREGTYIFCDA